MSEAQAVRGQRKVRVGTVVSDRMDKSVVVTSASGMARSTPAREIKGGTQTNPRNRYTPTDFTTWEQLSPRSIQPTQ